MAEKPSGDNKTHQIVMALITTIAAPVIVFFVTNQIKNSNSPAPTSNILVITATAPVPVDTQPAVAATKPAATATQTAATQPAATATQPPATAAKTATGKPTVLPTLTSVANPSGAIPAGTPVLVDGLVLTISKQDVKAEGKTISVSVHIKNTGSEKRTLVFSPGSISLKDDRNHSYERLYGDKKNGCKKDDLDDVHKIEIDPQGEVTLASVSADKAAGWCAASPGSAIPLFSGPVERNARKLQVQINGVGPFKGFQIEIGL